jgi:geranylgeranyl reductase family protein
LIAESSLSSLPEIATRPAARVWDAAIIGAGPAGSTAALNLAKRGHAVLLIDKDRFPRDKVCGDGLIADAIGALKRAGLYEEVLRLGYRTNKGTVYSPSRIRFDVEGEYLTLKRYLLDDLIKRKAEESGAVFLQSKITGVEPQTDHARITTAAGDGEPIVARVVMLATGASVELAEQLGLVTESRASAVALRCYVRSRVEIDRLIISYDRAITPGYAWIFPLGAGEYNVGCGIIYAEKKKRVNLRETFRLFETNFPEAIDLFKRADAVTPLRGARLRCGMRGTAALGRGNVLVIGEAIGATFPFTGEGIGKAMETGELAAEVAGRALGEADFSHLREFPERLERELKPKFLGYQIAEDWLSRPWLNDLVARRIRKSRFLQELVQGIVNETVDPREVFSVRGLVRSFIK